MAQVYEWLAEKQISVESFSVSRPEPGGVHELRLMVRIPPGLDAAEVGREASRLAGFAGFECK